MKYIVALLSLGLFIGILFNFNKESGNLAEVYLGGVVVNTKVAQSTEERQKGLSGRSDLGDNEGMLFIFEKPGLYRFWMKDMNFAIDIIWLDESLKVVSIKGGVEPSSYPEVFRPSEPAKYVLEVNAGFALRNKVQIADQAVFIE